MADVHSPLQRGYNMPRISGKWTKPEKKVHNYLKGRKIRHKMHPWITGNPDVFLTDLNIVLFLDGCFWHGCPKCYREPETNKKFWKDKIERNRKNDKKVVRNLKKQGFFTMRVWECSIKNNFEFVLNRIQTKSRVLT